MTLTPTLISGNIHGTLEYLPSANLSCFYSKLCGFLLVAHPSKLCGFLLAVHETDWLSSPLACHPLHELTCSGVYCGSCRRVESFTSIACVTYCCNSVEFIVVWRFVGGLANIIQCFDMYRSLSLSLSQRLLVLCNKFKWSITFTFTDTKWVVELNLKRICNWTTVICETTWCLSSGRTWHGALADLE